MMCISGNAHEFDRVSKRLYCPAHENLSRGGIVFCTRTCPHRMPFRVPDVSGKWHAQAKLPNNHQRSTNADVTLMLSQSEATVHGDATLKMDNSREEIRMPIPVAVINPKGKIQLEGTA
jgi:hypothetical protein